MQGGSSCTHVFMFFFSLSCFCFFVFFHILCGQQPAWGGGVGADRVVMERGGGGEMSAALPPSSRFGSSAESLMALHATLGRVAASQPGASSAIAARCHFGDGCVAGISSSLFHNQDLIHLRYRPFF